MSEYLVGKAFSASTCLNRFEFIVASNAALFSVIRAGDFRLSPAAAARMLGLPGSTELHRQLRCRELPVFPVLRDWYCLIQLVEHAERGSSLCTWAASRGVSASIVYRIVRARFGSSWGTLQQVGSERLRRRALQAWALYGLSGVDPDLTVETVPSICS